MLKGTLKALDESVEHWEALVVYPLNETGRNQCPLCDRFWTLTGPCERTAGKRFEICPVQKQTGYRGCGGTPYYDFQAADSFKGRQSAAQAELAFLKSLRPGGDG